MEMTKDLTSNAETVSHTETVSHVEYEELPTNHDLLQVKYDHLKEQYDSLLEKLVLARKKRFGPKAETAVIPGSFASVEAIAYLDASNNIAERSIKPFVIDRKNFLFTNTPNKTEAGTITFSIIETVKENGLDPYQYLTYIFKTAPRLYQSKPDWAEPLLPWNALDDSKVPKKRMTSQGRRWRPFSMSIRRKSLGF